MYKLYAVIVGILLATMISVNGALCGKLQNGFTLLIIHLAGIITTGIFLIITRKKVSIKGIPFYFLFGGFMGFFVVLLNNICVIKIGVALTIALSLLGQSIICGIIDHYGLLGMKIHKFKQEKIIGFCVVLAGIIVMTIY